MCPLCIGTAALLVSSGTSAGGLTALFLRHYRCHSLGRDLADSHLPQCVGDRRHGLPQGIGADRADAAHPEGIHGGQLALYRMNPRSRTRR